MTHDELIQQVRKAYEKARICAYKPAVNAAILERGTSRSISSLTEDLLGCYCAERAKGPATDRVLVEPGLSFKDAGLKNNSGLSSLLIKPDIALVKSGRVRVMFDLKMDLGHLRKDFSERATVQDERIAQIRGLSVQYKDGQDKDKPAQILNLARDLKLYYLVMSAGNIGSKDLEDHAQRIKGLKNVGMLLLTEGDHLNAYERDAHWTLHEPHLRRLDGIIEKAFGN